MIAELVDDFTASLCYLPQQHPKHRALQLLEEALRHERPFVTRHPTALFQQVWNLCCRPSSFQSEDETSPSNRAEKASLNSHSQPEVSASTNNEQNGLASPPSVDEVQAENPNLSTVFNAFRNSKSSAPLDAATKLLRWQNENYVCHEAVCPDCGVGTVCGTGDHTTELRVYFSGGDPHTLTRPIRYMRIKCGGAPIHDKDGGCSACTVGTGDVSGFFLIPLDLKSHPKWTQGTVREYLKAIRSPFASHPSLDGIPQGSAAFSGEPRSTEQSDFLVFGKEVLGRPEAPVIPSTSVRSSVHTATFEPTLLDHMEKWQAEKHRKTPEFVGARSLFPPSVHLGNPIETVMEGHRDRVLSVAVSADGRWIASGGRDNTLRVWDVRTGGQHRAFDHPGEVQHVIISEDGRFAAGGANNLFQRVWDIDNKREISELRGNDPYVRRVFFDNRGRVASLAIDKVIRLFDGETSRVAPLYDEEQRLPREVFAATAAFLGDGTLIAATSRFEGGVQVWLPELNRQLAVVEDADLRDDEMAFSADGSLLATWSYDGPIHIWRTEQGVLLTSLLGAEQCYKDIQFSPDGSRLVAHSEENAWLWDLGTGRQLATIADEDQMGIDRVVFTGDGKCLVVVGFGSVAWDTETGAEVAHRSVGKFEPWDITTDGGRLAVADQNENNILLFDKGEEVGTAAGHTSNVSCLAFFSDRNHLASGSWDESIRVWNTDAVSADAGNRGHDHQIKSACYSPDGKLIAVCQRSGRAELWQGTTMKKQQTLAESTNGATSVSISPNGQWISVGCGDHSIRMWPLLQPERQPLTFRGHSSEISSLTFQPGATRLASASWDKTVRIWDIPTGKEVHCLDGGKLGMSLITSISFSRDGAKLAIGDNAGMVWVWEPGSGQEPAWTAESHSSEIVASAFSMDGRWLVTSEFDFATKVWSMSDGSCVDALPGLTDPSVFVSSARWCAFARRQEVVIIDSASGAEVAWFDASLRSLVGHPNGQYWLGVNYDWLGYAFAAEGSFLGSRPESLLDL